MITFKKFLKSINYKINGSDRYCWDCYGDKAQIFDSGDNCISANAVVDLKNQTVYEITVCYYDPEVAFRFIHPKYRKKYNKEAKKRGTPPKQAWDNVDYVDIPEDSMLIILKEIKRLTKQENDDKVLP